MLVVIRNIMESKAEHQSRAVLEKSMVCHHSEFCAGFCSSQHDEKRVEKIKKRIRIATEKPFFYQKACCLCIP